MDRRPISREFSRQRAQNVEPFCNDPWSALKVTLGGRTQICCDFFTLLPEFGFPSAREFHSDGGMWNHPFMQHLRSTLGMPGEVPFCRLCLTTDKRDPKRRGEREIAKRQSLELYRRLDASAKASRYSGNLSSWIGRLPEFELPTGNGRTRRVFQQDVDFYRRVVESHGFVGRRRVMLFGCSQLAFAPFLAEACDHLVIAGPSATRAAMAHDLCGSLGLTTVSVLAASERLEFDDGSIDAVWVDGAGLLDVGNRLPLQEIARVMAAGAPMRVHRAPSMGSVVARHFAQAPADRRPGALRDLIDRLETEQNPVTFVRRALRTQLKRCRLALDVSVRVQAQPIRIDLTSATDEEQELVRSLLERFGQGPLDRIADLELDDVLSFSAVKPGAGAD